MRLIQFLSCFVLAGLLAGPTGVAQADEVTAAVAPSQPPANCVYARDVRSIEILNEDVVVIRGSRGRYWLNEFHNRCSGLRKNMVLSIARYGSQLCANDRVEAHDRGLVSIGPAASCRLGEFQPVAVEQVATLKAELGRRKES